MTLKFKKAAVFPFALTFFIFAYLLIFAAALSAVALFSLGLLSLAVSLGSISGIITVASDISPPSMLFTGFMCVFSSFAISAALYITAPKAASFFHKLSDWFMGISNHEQ